MSWTLDTQGNHLIIRSASELTIVDLNALHEAVFESAEQAETLTVDFSRLDDIDTSVVQWMLFLKRWSQAVNKPLHWSGFSASVNEMLGLYGLGERFDVPSEIRGHQPC